LLAARTVRMMRGAMCSPNAGSTNGVGQQFRSFGINELEMVGLAGAGWNQIVLWLRHVEAARAAAS